MLASAARTKLFNFEHFSCLPMSPTDHLYLLVRLHHRAMKAKKNLPSLFVTRLVALSLERGVTLLPG
jgi:hypothetical protein